MTDRKTQADLQSAAVNLSPDEIVKRAEACRVLPVEQVDRDEFAVALFLQGYGPRRAHEIAYVELLDNDGALQMLVRHRVRFAEQVSS